MITSNIIVNYFITWITKTTVALKCKTRQKKGRYLPVHLFIIRCMTWWFSTKHECYGWYKLSLYNQNELHMLKKEEEMSNHQLRLDVPFLVGRQCDKCSNKNKVKTSNIILCFAENLMTWMQHLLLVKKDSSIWQHYLSEQVPTFSLGICISPFFVFVLSFLFSSLFKKENKGCASLLRATVYIKDPASQVSHLTLLCYYMTENQENLFSIHFLSKEKLLRLDWIFWATERD